MEDSGRSGAAHRRRYCGVLLHPARRRWRAFPATHFSPRTGPGRSIRAPDGQEIVYAAQWDREPRQVFVTSRSGPESRLLGFKDMSLASISRAGELALMSASGTMN